MDLTQVLAGIGLSEKEAQVYLALLQLKTALPSSLSEKAQVKRPTTYVVLENLEKRGLATHIKKGKNLYYRALSPHSLLADQRQKYTSLEIALPELLQLHDRYTAVPQMSVFEGKKGLMQIMEDTLTARTDILCWADVDSSVDVLKDYYPKYIKKKIERKIWLRGIFAHSELALEFKARGGEELRDVRIIPKEKYPFKNEINIYDDKTAILSPSDEVGVIIQNQFIADTQRSIFKMGFEYAELLERDGTTSS